MLQTDVYYVGRLTDTMASAIKRKLSQTTEKQAIELANAMKLHDQQEWVVLKVTRLYTTETGEGVP